MSYNIQKKQKQTRRGQMKVVVTSLLLLIIFVTMATVWWYRSHPGVKKIQTAGGTIVSDPNVPGSTAKDQNPTTGSGASKDEGSDSPGSTNSAAAPAAPTGQFVSNHHPNLSGSPAPNTETSACTTDPGATCTIQFTSGSIVKTLPQETTDANGDATWSGWTLQNIGLTQGTWQVEAIASNNGKQASTPDAMSLVVGP